ncbi:hypothetical protein Poli38472_001404 [Pythium oligandrum]|uniref:Uncharacterized protein n=1 Tax=Pythium oligandrum TaxID=41045 RepID=A0A8K1CVY5_PYTOL|nr:hypothetical protein Poli38472_001404 [Pythium oligandrum]|eukprot:TMW69248.1 hypothetical protein Poli38472_001404 [Pythium oligandrum]
MGKKGGAGNKNNAKKFAPKKKDNAFKALKKQETRQGVVLIEKKGQTQSKPVVVKKHSRIPDEFRNFDERMAGARHKPTKAQAAKKDVVAAPMFTMAAPTFQFVKPVAPAPVQPEVEGFHGFLSAMQEPATAPPPQQPRVVRKTKTAAPPAYPQNNVFAVLDDEPAPVQPTAQSFNQASFMRPATFTLQSEFTAPSGGLTSLQRSLLGSSAAMNTEIDPDL